jgi:3-oxoacyl-[acyl-carrier protein] reductase
MTISPLRALVTGGSGEIGSVICRRLAAAGHHVCVHAHQNREFADALVSELIEAGHSAESVSFDVTDESKSRTQIEALLAQGPIQILVNNAGMHDDAVFPGMSASQWHRVIDVTVDGFFNVTQPIMMPMIRTRWGRVVNISSVSALIGNRGQNYSAAKGAGNYRHGSNPAIIRRRNDCSAGSDETRWTMRGGGRSGGILGVGPGRLHYRANPVD